MKQNIIFLAAILLFAACKPNDKTNTETTSSVTNMAGGEVTINGNIVGLDSGYITLTHQEGNALKTDSVKGIDDFFSFKTNLQEPIVYTLSIPDKEETQPLIFYSEPGTITIKGAADSLQKSVVAGSKTQEEFQKINDEIAAIFEKAEPDFKKFATARQNGDKVTAMKFQAFYDSLIAAANNRAIKYVQNNPGSVISATLLSKTMNSGGNTDELMKLFAGLSEPIKNSLPAKRLKADLESKKGLEIGGVAQNFTQNDMNGKPVSLASFKGKYMLLDFWASWCGPCRAENPNVVKAYNAFKTKGFDIFSVSLDEDKAEWLAAIKKDNLTWTHVSDLKGWENEVAQMYRVQSIPASFLLDKEGRIIAKDLRGAALEAKLKELMP